MCFLPDLVFLKSIQKGNVGIIGGSFNPPHLGHLYISEKVIKKLQLNILIWLITPLSPFKQSQFLLPLKKRKLLCQKLLKNQPQIKISTLENYLPNNYTFNTLKFLRNIVKPDVKLFWIMGEDLLYTFHNFYKWQDIISLVNIAIIARGENYSFLSLNQKFPQIMKIYSKYYNNYNIINKNTLTNPPQWYFLNLPKVDISSTKIRNKSI